MASLFKFRRRHPKTLVVLFVGRISGHLQDKRSLADQKNFCLEYLELHFPDCKIEMKVIAGVGKGEVLDRDEYRQVEDEIDSGQYDIVICEDTPVHECDIPALFEYAPIV